MAVLMTDQTEQLYTPCQVNVSQFEFLQITPGKFIEDITNQQGYNIRNINWIDNSIELEQLKVFANQIYPQSWAIGNHSTEEIIFLKNHFRESAVTIGILYNKTDYHWLLDNMARYHIFLLNTDPQLATKTDQEILNNLS